MHFLFPAIYLYFPLFLSIQRYNIDIKDKKQPLIVSRAKARDIRGGQDEQILLVPELCRATGITEDMRNDFR